MTDMMQDDECCSPRFHAAMLAGAITGDVWTCEECGCVWEAKQLRQNVRHWVCSGVPFTLIQVRG